MKLRKPGEKFFGEEYKEKVLDKEHHEKHLVGDISKSIQDEYTNQLNDIIKKHNHLDGVYYIYAVHSKDPRFVTAHKICFCTMRKQHLHQALKTYSTDMWEVDNDKGDLKLLWAIPPKAKVHKTKNKSKDPLTNKWIKEMQRGSK